MSESRGNLETAPILSSLTYFMKILLIMASKHTASIYAYITNSQCDQLPVGLIAKLVEQCICITEVTDSIPIEA